MRWAGCHLERLGTLSLGARRGVLDQRSPDAARHLVWFDEQPVSMVSISPTVAGVTRVIAVYTPPESRARGYASSAVAAVSRQALASGAQRCALFTDLSNPTSNKIYADVGYRPIAAWEEHTFGDR